jgi:hypothetical protein
MEGLDREQIGAEAKHLRARTLRDADAALCTLKTRVMIVGEMTMGRVRAMEESISDRYTLLTDSIPGALWAMRGPMVVVHRLEHILRCLHGIIAIHRLEGTLRCRHAMGCAYLKARKPSSTSWISKVSL